MATSSVPHLLILEPDSRGHVREWISYLVAAAHKAGPDALRLSLAVPPRLAEELERTLPPVRHRNVRAMALTPREVAACMHHRLWISGMARWWIMRRLMTRAAATHGLFLALDHLSLPLALGLGAGHRPLSGILFRPSVHYRHINAHRPSLRERLRDLRKAVLYRLMLRNPAVGAVLSLDPYFVDFAAHHYPRASKVTAIPDPVCPTPEPTADERRLATRVPDERKLFLLFGELTARKVEPYFLTYYANDWHLVAYCRLREAMRDFRASRIQDVEVLPEGFARQREVEADAIAEDAGFREVRVWLDGGVLPWARETPAFGFEREERSEDGSVFVFQMRELRRLMPWVLSWGPSARVLSPADVAREVRRQAEALASRYAED